MVKDLKTKFDYPIAGSLRIGEKNEKNIPTRLNYFTVHEDSHTEKNVIRQFEEKYNKPTKLLIRFLNDDPLEVSYLRYAKSGLMCKGDGEIANEVLDNEWKEHKCSEECKFRGKECKLTGRLLFIIKDLNIGGVWRLQTQSYNTIQNFLSTINFLKAMGIKITEKDFLLSTEERSAIVEGKLKKYTTVNLRMIEDSKTADTNLNENTIIDKSSNTDNLPKTKNIKSNKSDIKQEKIKKLENELQENSEKTIMQDDTNKIKTETTTQDVEIQNNQVIEEVTMNEVDDLEKALTLVESKEVDLNGNKAISACFCTMQSDDTIDLLIHPDILENFSKLEIASCIIPTEIYEKNNNKILKNYKIMKMAN